MRTTFSVLPPNLNLANGTHAFVAYCHNPLPDQKKPLYHPPLAILFLKPSSFAAALSALQTQPPLSPQRTRHGSGGRVVPWKTVVLLKDNTTDALVYAKTVVEGTNYKMVAFPATALVESALDHTADLDQAFKELTAYEAQLARRGPMIVGVGPGNFSFPSQVEASSVVTKLTTVAIVILRATNGIGCFAK